MMTLILTRFILGEMMIVMRLDTQTTLKLCRGASSSFHLEKRFKSGCLLLERLGICTLALEIIQFLGSLLTELVATVSSVGAASVGDCEPKGINDCGMSFVF